MLILRIPLFFLKERKEEKILAELLKPGPAGSDTHMCALPSPCLGGWGQTRGPGVGNPMGARKASPSMGHQQNPHNDPHFQNSLADSNPSLPHACSSLSRPAFGWAFQSNRLELYTSWGSGSALSSEIPQPFPRKTLRCQVRECPANFGWYIYSYFLRYCFPPLAMPL